MSLSGQQVVFVILYADSDLWEKIFGDVLFLESVSLCTCSMLPSYKAVLQRHFHTFQIEQCSSDYSSVSTTAEG